MKIHLYHGGGLIGSAIKWQTRGKYSHAAVSFGNHLFEAKEFVGTVLRDMNEGDRKSDIFEITKSFNKGLSKEFLGAQIGKPYDYGMVLRFLSRRQETRRSRGRWFCSELVYAAVAVGGLNLFRDTEPWEVSPSFLARSPFLQKISANGEQWMTL